MSWKSFGQVVFLLVLSGAIGIGGIKAYRGGGGGGPTPVEVKPPVADLGDYFHAWADILRRDQDGIIDTTSHFQQAYITGAKLLVSGTDYERVAGRDQEIGDRIEAAIGLDDRPITPELRATLAATMQAIGDDL